MVLPIINTTGAITMGPGAGADRAGVPVDFFTMFFVFASPPFC